MMDLAFARKVGRKSMMDALDYFCIGDRFLLQAHYHKRRPVGTPKWVGCVINYNMPYLQADIHIYLTAIPDYPELWRCLAHEIAHLASADFDLIKRMNPPEEPDKVVWNIIEENVTTRLERMFTRDNPYPGDDFFEGEEEA